MVDHAAFVVGGLHTHGMVHEVRGEFGCGLAAIGKAPYDAPRIASFVDLYDADVVGRVAHDVAHVAARTRGKEVSTTQAVGLNAHVHPNAGLFVEERTRLLNFLFLHAVGEVAAVAFVPTLLPAVVAQAAEAAHECQLLNSNAGNSSASCGNAAIQRVLGVIENIHLRPFVEYLLGLRRATRSREARDALPCANGKSSMLH